MKNPFAIFRLRQKGNTVQGRKISRSGSQNGGEEDWTTVRLTDTIRWFNASYAILSKVNRYDYNRFAGLPANEKSRSRVQDMLSEWWSVTDRESADQTLDWILEEGHRARFTENQEKLRRMGVGQVMKRERVDFLRQLLQTEEKEAEHYAHAYGLYDKYGPEAIDGWDYCRAMNLMSFFYLAGYYSEQEALDKSLEIARMIQPKYTSWEDLIDSYLRGYEYWAKESSDKRRAIYESLKAAPDNPYRVDFKTKLEKSW